MKTVLPEMSAIEDRLHCMRKVWIRCCGCAVSILSAGMVRIQQLLSCWGCVVPLEWEWLCLVGHTCDLSPPSSWALVALWMLPRYPLYTEGFISVNIFHCALSLPSSVWLPVTAQLLPLLDCTWTWCWIYTSREEKEIRAQVVSILIIQMYALG